MKLLQTQRLYVTSFKWVADNPAGNPTDNRTDNPTGNPTGNPIHSLTG